MPKKNIINVGGLHCPLSPWYPARYKNGFDYTHGPRSHIISPKHFTFYSHYPAISTTNSTRSCRSVMSFSHVILSYPQLQTKYDYHWIIYTNQITNNNYEKRTNKNSNHVDNVLHLLINSNNNIRTNFKVYTFNNISKLQM